MNRLSKIVSLVAFVFIGFALVQQLRIPAADRTWTGRVLGVPYNFHPANLPRVVQEVWDPHNPHMLVPHAFGMGWGINLAALVRRIQITIVGTTPV